MGRQTKNARFYYSWVEPLCHCKRAPLQGGLENKTSARGCTRDARSPRVAGGRFWAVRGEPKCRNKTSNKTSKGEVLFFCALAWVSSTSLSTSLIGPEREVEAPLGRVRSEKGRKGGISRRGVGSLSRRGRSGGKRQHSFSRPLSPALSSPSHSLSPPLALCPLPSPPLPSSV